MGFRFSFFILTSFFAFSCNETEPLQVLGTFQVYTDVAHGFNGDTVNKTDVNGLKQGEWVTFNEGPGMQGGMIDSVGIYKDNKKIGYWKKYHIGYIDSALYENGLIILDTSKVYKVR